MNSHPDISIIIPIYNSASTIQACIESIMQQDFSGWEVIVIDDGSTDESYKICQELSYKDKRIITFQQLHKGVSEARNLGISKAHGKHICFVDADDTIETDYLSSLYSYRKYDMVICGYYVDSYNEEQCLFHSEQHLPDNIKMNSFQNKEALLPLFLKGMIHINCIKLLNLDIIKKHDIKYRNHPINEDYMFMVAYLMHAHSICTLSKPLYHWNRRINQKSGVDSIPYNLLSIYNEAHILTREFFNNDKVADRILYYSYHFIVLKYFTCLGNNIYSCQTTFNKLKEFHRNPLVKASYEAYTPQSRNERFIHELQKRGYFRLYYLLHKTLLKWISK